MTGKNYPGLHYHVAKQMMQCSKRHDD